MIFLALLVGFSLGYWAPEIDGLARGLASVREYNGERRFSRDEWRKLIAIGEFIHSDQSVTPEIRKALQGLYDLIEAGSRK